MIEEKNEQMKQYKSQIKCLKSDQERLKKNSEEEVEKLNEVIEKLQEELSHIEQNVTVSFTGMAEITGGSTYQPALSPPLDEHADVNVDSTVLDHKNVEGEEQVSTTFSQVTPSSMQDMESSLQQFQETVKERDLNLKQYYEQVMALKEEAKVLNETVERLKLELTEKDQKLNDIETSKNLPSPINPETSAYPPLGSTDETLNRELEATRKELKQVKEELEKLRTSSQNIMVNELAAAKSKEVIDVNHKASIEHLTEALRDKTAQHLAVEALLVSVQETTLNTISNLQCQVEELQKTIQEKESQLQDLRGNAQLLENQEIKRLNYVVKKLQQDLIMVEEKSSGEFKNTRNVENETTPNEMSISNRTSLQRTMESNDEKAMLSKEVEEAKKELALVKEELKHLRAFKNHSDMTEGTVSREDGSHSDHDVIDPGRSATENKVQATAGQPLPEDTEKTTQTSEANMESQLQELKEVLIQKDLELLQYVNQKDVFDDQARQIELLNEEIRELKQDLTEASSDFNKNVKTESSKEMLENKESVELDQAKAALGEREIELAVLMEELTKLQMAQKHDVVTVKSASTQVDVAEPELTDLEQTLKAKAAELLESQTLNVSLEETTKFTIHNMEMQLQELQKVVEQKDLELQHYVQLKDLYNQQMKEAEQKNELVRTLQQELAQSGSSVHTSEAVVCTENELSQRTELENEELMQAKTELEKAKTDLAALKEELSKVNLAEIHDNKSHGEGEAVIKVTELEQALREKTAELIASQAVLTSLDETTQATIYSLQSELQELQEVVQLKDLELLQYENQKDLIDQQTKDIERLNILINMSKQNSEVANIRQDVQRFSEALQENEVLQNNASLASSELVQTKAELERTKMELAAMTEEIKIRLSEKHDDMPDNNTPSEVDVGDTAHKLTNLEQALREKTADLLASQTLLTSMEETSQATIHNMESELQELRKSVQLKDSELLQNLNHQNILNQQTKEIEHLNGVIDCLQKELEEAQQRTSVKKPESAVQEGRSKKLERELTEQMNGGEMAFIKTLDAKTENEYEEPFRQLYSTREGIPTLDSGKRMSDGDVTAVMENKDQCDWMIEALRDQNTQLLSNQSLFTSVQETMQSTIDSLETQLEELQKVVKEKDMEILLYLEEIEILKEQVKVKTNEHDQILLDMEDSLREKVAAALVSEAQLKAIQFHTKCMHADDRPTALVEESRILHTHRSNLSQQGESESKSSVLNLQLLELEKQLSDLHEQLQVERDQVILTNQLAAEKEKQLLELQQLLKSTKEKQSITWPANESTSRDVALLQVISCCIDLDLMKLYFLSDFKTKLSKEYLKHNIF